MSSHASTLRHADPHESAAPSRAAIAESRA